MINHLESDEKLDDIAEAAMRLVDLLGAEYTSIADIARELKIPPDGIYRIYASKEEIYQAVAGRLLSEIETVLSNVVRRRAPAKQNFMGALQEVTNLHAKRVASNPNLQSLLRTAYKEKWPIVDQHVRVFENSISAMISRCVAEGAFDVEDLDDAASVVRIVCMRFLLEKRVDVLE